MSEEEEGTRRRGNTMLLEPGPEPEWFDRHLIWKWKQSFNVASRSKRTAGSGVPVWGFRDQWTLGLKIWKLGLGRA